MLFSKIIANFLNDRWPAQNKEIWTMVYPRPFKPTAILAGLG